MKLGGTTFCACDSGEQLTVHRATEQRLNANFFKNLAHLLRMRPHLPMQLSLCRVLHQIQRCLVLE